MIPAHFLRNRLIHVFVLFLFINHCIHSSTADAFTIMSKVNHPIQRYLNLKQETSSPASNEEGCCSSTNTPCDKTTTSTTLRSRSSASSSTSTGTSTTLYCAASACSGDVNCKPININGELYCAASACSSTSRGRKDCVPTRLSSTALALSGGATAGGDEEVGIISEDDVRNKQKERKKLVKEMIAEFLGTFIIVQIGCGTVCSAIFLSAQQGLWQIAAVWSIAVTLAISTTASISGAHLNPAVTVALALFRKFQVTKIIPYCIAQLLGATAAAGINLSLFYDSIMKFESTNGIVRGTIDSIASAKAFGEYWSVSSWQRAFLAEAFGTGFLTFIIFALTHPRNETTSKHPMMIPPLIGCTVGALISVLAPLTQGGFNPARDFGPRIIAAIAGWGSIAMKGWWVYVAAPLVGAPIGAFIVDKFLYSNEE